MYNVNKQRLFKSKIRTVNTLYTIPKSLHDELIVIFSNLTIPKFVWSEDLDDINI